MSRDRSTPMRIFVNFFSRFAGRIMSIGISIVVMGMLGRYLGEQQYGEYAFWYGMIFFLQQFSDIGLEVIIVREIAKKQDSVSLFFGDAIVLKGALSSLFLALIAVLAVLAVPRPSVPFLLVVSLAAVIGASQDVSIWVFRGMETMEYEAILTVFSQLVWITCIWLFIAGKLGILHMLAAQLAANVLRTCLGFALAFLKGIRPSFQFDRDRYRTHLKVAIPVGITFITSVTYNYANVALLKALAEPEDIAAYNVGVTLTTGFLFVAITMITSFFPVFSRYVQDQDPELPAFYGRVSKLLVMAAAPISMALLFLAQPIITLVFRQGFETSILSLRILSATLALRFLNRMYRFLFPACDRQTANLRHELVGILVSLVLSIALIPRHGYLGACAAFVASETVVFAFNYIFISRIISPLPLADVFLKPFLASLTMGGALLLLQDAPLSVLILAGLVVYPTALFVFRAFSLEEWGTIRDVLKQAKSFRLAQREKDRVQFPR